MGKYQSAKQCVLKYFDALEKADASGVRAVLKEWLTPDYEMRSVYPFRELSGADAVAESIWEPLKTSLAHMQRRQDIFMAGDNEFSDEIWVMSMGHFMGLFDRDWLGIRRTGKMVSLRYAEFICVKDNKIAKTGLFLDLIGLMAQAGVYPLPPMTGQYFVYPGPRQHNGLLYEDAPESETKDTLALVKRMCDELNAENDNMYCPPAVYEHSFSADMIWYGPAGIGASYTIPRYLRQHQWPFSAGLCGKQFNGHVVRFAEGNFACWFGWPNLTNMPVGGFLGLPGGNIPADMQVVDVYSCENGMISENWVFIDIPWWLKQQGLDIFDRTQYIENPTDANLGI